MGNGPAEGSDAAIYPDLARANLLRMRGDYRAALEHCRTILHKFPNNVTANQLLGDLCAESGDLEQAKEWYELALDLAPNSAQIRNKLNDVRQRIEHHETAGIVEQLGLPPEKSKSGWIGVGLAGLVVAVGIIAYIVGTRAQANTASGPIKKTSVQAPIVNSPRTDTAPSTTTAPETVPATTPSGGSSSEEQSLQQLVAQRSVNGAKLRSILLDPRSGLAVVTYEVQTQEEEKTVGAELASSIFDNSPSTRVVSVRALRGGALSYVADARREAFEQTKSDDWKNQNSSDPGALAKHLLTQEWSSSGNTAPAPDSASSNSEGAASSPTTTGT